MARINGFYKVVHHNRERIMKWTTTNEDNTYEISGYWEGNNGYNGNDHDLSYVDEKRLKDREVLDFINKTFNSPTPLHSSSDCENEAIEFTKLKIKTIESLLTEDYKIGYKEGVEHYIKSINQIK